MTINHTTPARPRRIAASAMLALAAGAFAAMALAPAAQADEQFDAFKQTCATNPALFARGGVSGVYSEQRLSEAGNPDQFGPDLEQTCKVYGPTRGFIQGKLLTVANRQNWMPLTISPSNPALPPAPLAGN